MIEKNPQLGNLRIKDIHRHNLAAEKVGVPQPVVVLNDVSDARGGFGGSTLLGMPAPLM